MQVCGNVPEPIKLLAFHRSYVYMQQKKKHRSKYLNVEWTTPVLFFESEWPLWKRSSENNSQSLLWKNSFYVSNAEWIHKMISWWRVKVPKYDNTILFFQEKEKTKSITHKWSIWRLHTSYLLNILYTTWIHIFSCLIKSCEQLLHFSLDTPIQWSQSSKANSAFQLQEIEQV